MRLPAWLRGLVRSRPEDTSGSARETGEAATPGASGPPDPGWRALPAIQRAVEGSTPGVAHLDTFGHTLASHQDPRFLEPLGHHVTVEAPTGHVDGLATPARAAVPHLPSSPALVAQRMTFGRATSDEHVDPSVAAAGSGAIPLPPLPVASAPDHHDVPTTGGPPVQRTPVTGNPTSVLAAGAREAAAPATTPGGTGLIGDVPLAVRRVPDGGTPVQRATPSAHVSAPREAGDPGAPVRVSRLAQPSSTTGNAPAPQVRSVPVVSGAAGPGPPPASGVRASGGGSAEVSTPAEATDVVTTHESTSGLVGDLDLLTSVRDIGPEHGTPDEPGRPASYEGGTSPTVQRSTGLTPRIDAPRAALHWPRPSAPAQAPVAVLPRPPLEPSVSATGGAGGGRLPGEAPGADLGVQRAVFLPAVTGPEAPALTRTSVRPPGGLDVTSTPHAPPTPAPPAPSPAVHAPAPPAPSPAFLQRTLHDPLPLGAQRAAGNPVPLTPLPSPRRGVLPPAATPLAPAVPDARVVSALVPGGVPAPLQRLSGPTVSSTHTDAVVRRPAPRPDAPVRSTAERPPTSWTEIALPEPAATSSAVSVGLQSVATTTLQRQVEGDPGPSPEGVEPTGGGPDSPEAAPAIGGAAAPLSASGAPATPGAKAAELDELARRLYEPLTARLRAELWLDRERTGRSMTR